MAKSKNRIWLWVGLSLVVILVALVVFSSLKEDKTYVSTEEVEKRDLVETVTANGTIQPEIEVKISSEVSGEITQLFVKEGDSVIKGDLLLQVNPDISESNVERAKASVNNARANLAASQARVVQAKARLLQSENSFKRSEKLFKDKVIPLSEFETAQAEYESAKGELEAAMRAVDGAHYTVKSLESTLSGEEKTLQRTSIFAPMNGIVSKLGVEKGERVVGTMQMTGTELLRIADFRTMELSVDVGESDIIRVSRGDTAEIEVDAYDGRTFVGIVKEVANSSKSLGATTGNSDQVTNFEVKITILRSSYEDLLKQYPGKASPFLPGMSGMADIKTKRASNILSVPIEAVTLREMGKDSAGIEKKDEKEEVVFILEGGKAIKRKVKTGMQDSRYIEISEGVTEKQVIITGPYNVVSRMLKDGMAVEVKDKKELFKPVED